MELPWRPTWSRSPRRFPSQGRRAPPTPRSRHPRRSGIRRRPRSGHAQSRRSVAVGVAASARRGPCRGERVRAGVEQLGAGSARFGYEHASVAKERGRLPVRGSSPGAGRAAPGEPRPERRQRSRRGSRRGRRHRRGRGRRCRGRGRGWRRRNDDGVRRSGRHESGSAQQLGTRRNPAADDQDRRGREERQMSTVRAGWDSARVATVIAARRSRNSAGSGAAPLSWRPDHLTPSSLPRRQRRP